jgi:hypothetical protein
MVVDPQVRARALSAGCVELQRLRCEQFEFENQLSQPDQHLLLKYRIKSILGLANSSPIFSRPDHWHVLRLTPSRDYPERISNDDIRFVTQPIFHPNVFTDGRVCIRDHVPSESLGRFALRLGEMIRFAPNYIGADSPANGLANEWCRHHPHEIPTDVFAPPPLKGVVLGRVSSIKLGRISQ